MNKKLASITAAGTLLAMCAAARDVTSGNIVGFASPTTVVTGEVAVAYNPRSGVPVGQIAGSHFHIPVVIRGLVDVQVEGPPEIADVGVWFLVTSGKLSDIVVEGAPLPLASQTISNGLIRTKDFGSFSIYLYKNKNPVALVVPIDQSYSLAKWLDTKRNAAHAEQQGGGHSPPAARSPKPTP